MKLVSGEQLVRLTALTPANLGSAYGEATLDRPTQKDSHLGLPFLPDSALKGVLAGAWGDAGDAGNPAREALFGSADHVPTPKRAGRSGEPGPLVFGNAELLAFPVPALEGPPAWVFPAVNLARALRPEEAPPAGEDLLRLLAALEEPGFSRAFAWPRLPRLDAAVRLEPVRDRTARLAAPELVALLQRYAGPGLPADAPLLVVSGARAGELWRFAAERRALVALDSATRTVAGGALRFVELIPPGTVFLSLVSCLLESADALPELPNTFQAGAWEGLGLGWLQASRIEPAGASPLPALEPGDGPVPLDRAWIMVEAHQAVERLEGQAPALQRAIRSAVRQFGGRAQFSGLEAALAFELAKARPAHPKPSLEARAHRWLLSALLTAAPEPPATKGADGELQAWIASDPFAPGHLPEQRPLLLARWLWLARSCEHLLEAEEE